MTQTTALSNTMTVLMERIRDKQEEIHAWLKKYEGANELPLYSSVDIREAGFKMAVVDTNIFLSGFNNLCEHGLEDSVKFLKEAINKRVPHCRNILIIAEEHTRNVWYLENVRILEEIARKAGFNVKIATFLTVQPQFCENDRTRFVELETASGQPVRLHCFKKILEDYEAGIEKFCLIILNNDLTQGIPQVLAESKVPIYPSTSAGWHSRLKSHHFAHTSDLLKEFGKMLDIDPWFLGCQYDVVDKVNINDADDRERIHESAVKLFGNIQKKYDEHNIKEKPYVVLKADAGTYGMGVVPVEGPEEILTLNRKIRNSLSKGKGAKEINRILLQEGVPTIHNVEQKVSEVVIYQIENNLIGGFYRSHTGKNPRENLNAPRGMSFQRMCPHLKKYGDCGVHHDINIFDVYRILARIAGIAAHREIIHLEANKK